VRNRVVPLAITAQDTTFDDVEKKLTNALLVMTNYFDNNQLKPNSNKTQVCGFYLRNRDAKKHFNLEWLGNTLHNTDYPVYHGVALDRTLTFKEHCSKTKMKVQARNNLLVFRKLAANQWGSRPHTMRTTGIALCLSTGEYACPVWSQSKHVKNVSVVLNDTCSIKRDVLDQRLRPAYKLYLLSSSRHSSTCRN